MLSCSFLIQFHLSKVFKRQNHTDLRLHIQIHLVKLRSWAQLLLKLFQWIKLTLILVSIQTPAHQFVFSKSSSFLLSLSSFPSTPTHTFKLIFLTYLKWSHKALRMCIFAWSVCAQIFQPHLWVFSLHPQPLRLFTTIFYLKVRFSDTQQPHLSSHLKVDLQVFSDFISFVHQVFWVLMMTGCFFC